MVGGLQDNGVMPIVEANGKIIMVLMVWIQQLTQQIRISIMDLFKYGNSLYISNNRKF